jgi:hypothetical protein
MRGRCGGNGLHASRKSCGAEGDRTPDLGIANAALSRLSYCPNTPEIMSIPNEVKQNVLPHRGAILTFVSLLSQRRGHRCMRGASTPSGQRTRAEGFATASTSGGGGGH